MKTKRNDFLKYCSALNDQVKAQFVDNPSIKFIESGAETVVSDGIPFEVRLITSLASKPTLKDSTKSTGAKPKKKVTFDPFMPPFEPGLFITEISSTHNLLFNKFMICKMHSLVTTKDMER